MGNVTLALRELDAKLKFGGFYDYNGDAAEIIPAAIEMLKNVDACSGFLPINCNIGDTVCISGAQYYVISINKYLDTPITYNARRVGAESREPLPPIKSFTDADINNTVFLNWE